MSKFIGMKKEMINGQLIDVKVYAPGVERICKVCKARYQKYSIGAMYVARERGLKIHKEG